MGGEHNVREGEEREEKCKVREWGGVGGEHNVREGEEWEENAR